MARQFKARHGAVVIEVPTSQVTVTVLSASSNTLGTLLTTASSSLRSDTQHLCLQNIGANSIWFQYNGDAVVDSCFELSAGEIKYWHEENDNLALWEFIAATSDTLMEVLQGA